MLGSLVISNKKQINLVVKKLTEKLGNVQLEVSADQGSKRFLFKGTSSSYKLKTSQKYHVLVTRNMFQTFLIVTSSNSDKKETHVTS